MEKYEQLEKEFATWTKTDNMVSCSSGTAALHLALEVAPLLHKSLIAIPDFSMIACARAISMANYLPVFIRCREEDLLLDPEILRQAVKIFGIQGVMAVHTYGRVCNMDAIAELADQYSLYLVEDLAEAHGVTPHPRTDAACWSFYKNKVVAGEEGGAVAFRNPAHADLARSLRSLGFTSRHDFNHIPRGHNYRLANSLAFLILKSLRNYGNNYYNTTNGRVVYKRLYDRYCPQEWRMPERRVLWVYDLRIGGMTQEQQDRVVKSLRSNGIEARHGFKPLHSQLEYKNTQYQHSYSYGTTNTETLAREIIYLPMSGLSSYDAIHQQAEMAFNIIKTELKTTPLQLPVPPLDQFHQT